MTADEIRAQATEISIQDFGSDAIWCRALLEIAAQLAELNARLDSITAHATVKEKPELGEISALLVKTYV